MCSFIHQSSVMQAILGELPLRAGLIDIKGKVSYAAQQPWIFSGTIRQNIIFGEKYDALRYKKVLKGEFANCSN